MTVWKKTKKFVEVGHMGIKSVSSKRLANRNAPVIYPLYTNLATILF